MPTRTLSTVTAPTVETSAMPLTLQSISPTEAAGATENPARECLIIDAAGSGSAFHWREYWQYRELLGFLALRDIKARYKQSILGIAWAAIHPLISTIVYTVVLRRLVQIPSDGIRYPLFAFSSLLIWNLFSSILMRSTNSVVSNGHLIAKVFFPRLLIPVSSVLVCVIDYVFACVAMAVLFPFFGVFPSMASLVAVPVITILVATQALGLSLILAPLNVRFRDVSHVLPFLTQLWMFATPVLYPLSQIPENWRWVVWINPMIGYVEAYRSVLFGLPLAMAPLVASVSVSFATLVIGVMIFRRFESNFSDIL